jgi:D-arabinose 1-dehydrogenase-like Zn-dependent alcohol dehydrogenase
MVTVELSPLTRSTSRAVDRGYAAMTAIEVIPNQQVNEANERVIKGDLRFRFVIDLTSLK